MADVEIMARVERRRRWTAEEKAALLAEVEAEGGKVAVVARRHRVSESLLYNWRSAWKTAAVLTQTQGPVEFVPLGVFGRADDEGPAMLSSVLRFSLIVGFENSLVGVPANHSAGASPG